MFHVTWQRPFQGWFAIHGLALAVISLSTKFKVAVFIHYENTKDDTKYLKRDGLGSYGSVKVTGNSAIR